MGKQGIRERAGIGPAHGPAGHAHLTFFDTQQFGDGTITAHRDGESGQPSRPLGLSLFT